MPYKTSGTPQKNSGQPEIIDVFSSGDVYINGVKVALSDNPTPVGTAASSIAPVSWTALGLSSIFNTLSRSSRVVISSDDQSNVDSLLSAYATNPSAFNNSAASRNDVQNPFPGNVPDGAASNPANSEISPTSIESDIPAWIAARLAEADKWGRTSIYPGQPSNPNIVGIWVNLGFPDTPYWRTDMTPWCMGTVNLALKSCGYRYVKTAAAKDITTNPGAWNATQIAVDQGKPGDIVYWTFGHVNFIYTAGGPGGIGPPYTFAGGNQSPHAVANAHPAGWSGFTQAWASGWNNSSPDLGSIWRPSKS